LAERFPSPVLDVVLTQRGGSGKNGDRVLPLLVRLKTQLGDYLGQVLRFASSLNTLTAAICF